MNSSKSAERPRHEKARSRHGKEQTKQVPHKALAQFSAGTKRADPIATLLSSEKGRIPDLLPEKYKRMQPNAFAFFRGSVGIMASDLAVEPHTKLFVQLCGDAHLQNLGCFASPDGRIVFDINDFDETARGPWEWDVKRMATSVVLAGSECHHDASGCEEAVHAFARSYCSTMASLAAEPILTSARHIIHRPGNSGPVNAAFQQAERAKPSDLLAKYTTKVSGHYRFKRVDGEWPVSPNQSKAVLRSLAAYRNSLPPERLHFFQFYEPMDVAFKIVGTGSVGLRDYVVLMEGRNPEDVLFLQIKQEVLSVYAPYLKLEKFDNQGERVVVGQHRVQPLSDLLLGWTSIGKHDYLVRQLNDHKGSINIETMKGPGLSSLTEVAGELLARGHARSGDALAISAYLGDGNKVSQAIVHFARDYSSQVVNDFHAFHDAIASKRIKTADPS